MRSTLLFFTCLATGIFGISDPGFALGGGGSGANIPSYTINATSLGPLSGAWSFSGGADAFVSTVTNATPRAFSNEGSLSPSSQYSLGIAAIQIHKGGGWLNFDYWGGLCQTPTTGITSDYGAFNSLARFGSKANPYPRRPTFKWWFTVLPSQYWSVSAGEMASTEGSEVGFDWMNPTAFVSNLNNMQTTPGYGAQLNLFYRAVSFNLQYSEAYHTTRVNILSYLLTYNLNSAGSDNAILFGHTNLGHTGNPGKPHVGVGLGFSEANSTLIGAGLQFLAGAWTFIPEFQYQWLPKSAVTAASGDPRPLIIYFETSAMMDVTYQFNGRWSLTAQPQIVYQNGDRNDPNQALFGNWLQYDSTPGPGTFSAGTVMTGLQISPTWQRSNLFFRPMLDFTHLAGFASGTGYGTGEKANQFVALAEAGFLIGK